MHTRTHTGNGILFAALAAAPFAYAAPPDFTADLTATFATRYVTEGVDNDPDSSGYLFTEATATLDVFTFGAMYAQSLRGSSFNEVNAFGGFGWETLGVALFTGLNYLAFPATGDPDEWEWFLGFEYETEPEILFFGEAYYGFDEINGGFIEAGAAYAVAAGDGFEVIPYALLGTDFGYVSDSRRLRANNFQAGVHVEYAAAPNAVLFAGAHHSFRLSNLRRAGEGDVSWLEAGVSVAF
ncbi:MAG: hypothetical protein JJU00_11520 [Opitutales bacterium]|nr:hypothetical protein [Opitutales bacterium]